MSTNPDMFCPMSSERLDLNSHHRIYNSYTPFPTWPLLTLSTLITKFLVRLDMVTYRTSMQIVADLLDATQLSGQEGIKTTSLLTKANLSHSRLSKFLANLTGAGLINKIEFDGKNTFVITSKGRQYLESYRNFSSIAQSFGLEL